MTEVRIPSAAEVTLRAAAVPPASSSLKPAQEEIPACAAKPLWADPEERGSVSPSARQELFLFLPCAASKKTHFPRRISLQKVAQKLVLHVCLPLFAFLVF